MICEQKHNSQLQKIYESMPKTFCTKSSCATGCCSKLENSRDAEGNFMPLPLVYGVEYVNILDFLRKATSPHSVETFDYSKKSLVCPFKDPSSPRCSIYPVRPFSCRVFGRSVPPVFWGVEIDPEQAKAVHCEDMRIEEPEKVSSFNERYPLFWQQLAQMSLENSPFSKEQRNFFQKVLNTPDLTVLAFGEFYFLTQQSQAWFEKEFLPYWKIMGNIL